MSISTLFRLVASSAAIVSLAVCAQPTTQGSSNSTSTNAKQPYPDGETTIYRRPIFSFASYSSLPNETVPFSDQLSCLYNYGLRTIGRQATVHEVFSGGSLVSSNSYVDFLGQHYDDLKEEDGYFGTMGLYQRFNNADPIHHPLQTIGVTTNIADVTSGFFAAVYYLKDEVAKNGENAAVSCFVVSNPIGLPTAYVSHP